MTISLVKQPAGRIDYRLCVQPRMFSSVCRCPAYRKQASALVRPFAARPAAITSTGAINTYSRLHLMELRLSVSKLKTSLAKSHRPASTALLTCRTPKPYISSKHLVRCQIFAKSMLLVRFVDPRIVLPSTPHPWQHVSRRRLAGGVTVPEHTRLPNTGHNTTKSRNCNNFLIAIAPSQVLSGSCRRILIQLKRKISISGGRAAAASVQRA